MNEIRQGRETFPHDACAPVGVISAIDVSKSKE
jgi:hypothetical protein